MTGLRKMCYLGMCIALVFCAGCKGKETVTLQEVTEESTKEKKEPSGEDAPEDVEEEAAAGQFVHVCGAVKSPGVYELPRGSRVYEAILAAGGMTPEADGTSLNQAELTEDGERIYVPEKGETENQESAGITGNGREDGRVNLNTATKEELMTLSGIGEAKAESIIRYREENGSFRSAEDIMNIEGIKEGVFNKIKEQIVVK